MIIYDKITVLSRTLKMKGIQVDPFFLRYTHTKINIVLLRCRYPVMYFMCSLSCFSIFLISCHNDIIAFPCFVRS